MAYSAAVGVVCKTPVMLRYASLWSCEISVIAILSFILDHHTIDLWQNIGLTLLGLY